MLPRRIRATVIPPLLTAGLLVSVSHGTAQEPPPRMDRVLSFETQVECAIAEVHGGGEVQSSPARYVHGRKSLAWDWKDGSILVISAPNEVLTPEQSRELWLYGIAFFGAWFYQSEARPGAKLRVEFGRGDTGSAADCWFDMGLNFQGWRTARMAFDHDMQGGHRGRFDWLRLVAPEGSGRLYIDKVVPMAPNDQRNRARDHQFPDRHPPQQFHPPAATGSGTPPTEAELAGAELILQRTLESLETEMKTRRPDPADVLARLAELELAEGPEGLRGRHVTLRNLVAGKYYYSDRDLSLNDSVDFRDAQGLLLDLAIASRQEEETPLREALVGGYLLLVRHLLDQGWAVGSGRGSTSNFGYASREWFRATLIMRQELDAAGLLQPTLDAMSWYLLEFVDVSGPPPREPVDCNMDYLGTIVRSQLLFAAAHGPGARKVELLRSLSAYLDAILSRPTAGRRGGFKVDGTAFHHWGHYPAYAFNGMRGAVDILATLHGTPFALSADAHANIRRAVRAAWLYSNGTVPLALCGRHPFRMPAFARDGSGIFTLCRRLALLGYPGTSGTVDSEMAGIYLHSAGLTADDALGLFGERIAPLPPPDGHWSFNYGCFGIHRAAGRMVVLKGFSRDVWATEIYAGYRKPGGANNFGVYQSHGAVQVMMPGGPPASGLQAAGWDWSLNPGCTTIRYPIPLLKNPEWRTFMPTAGGRWTLNGQSNFAGSAHLENRYGVFAFELLPTNPANAYSQPPYDAAFRARKSVFAWGNRLICLGSGIHTRTSDYPTCTTLFQLGLGDDSPPTWLSSTTPITEFPYARRQDGASWLVDHLGQGYVVESGDPVELRRQVQQSRNDHNTQDTEGRFATAWINHGAAPANAGYVYTLLLETTPEATADYAASLHTATPPYRIVQRDDRAHIVHDPTADVTGYAIFEPAVDLPAGLVARVDRPALIVATARPDGAQRLAVCDPTLNLNANDQSEPRRLTVMLRGRWILTAGTDHADARPQGDNTELIVTTLHGLSRQFTLTPAPTP